MMHIKNNTKLILVGIFLACFAAVAIPAFAADTNPASFQEGLDQVKTLAGESGLSEGKSTKEILQTIVKWLLSLTGTIATISLLYGGYLYITSQGEEDKAAQAKNIILYSVIGILIIGISAVIVNVVINIATK